MRSDPRSLLYLALGLEIKPEAYPASEAEAYTRVEDQKWIEFNKEACGLVDVLESYWNSSGNVGSAFQASFVGWRGEFEHSSCSYEGCEKS